MTSNPIPTPGRWLHRWAIVTVCVTTVQLVLGTVVTTFKVGMADPVWPTAPWQLLLVSWQEPQAGYLIEHTHRATGHLVGLAVLGLSVALWWGERRIWLRALGMLGLAAMILTLALGFAFLKHEELWLPAFAACVVVCLAVMGLMIVIAARLREPRVWLSGLGTLALAGVIGQGLLGGFRVHLHVLLGENLALIHGISAQLLFALLVSIALFTAPNWGTMAVSAETPRLRHWSLVTVGFVLAQIVLGACVRHTNSTVWGRLHLLTAFGVVASITILVRSVLTAPERDRQATWVARILMALVVVQLLLGVEAWMFKFSSGELPELVQMTVPKAILLTAHVLVGSWILATAVALACRTHQRAALVVRLTTTPARPLEGAA
jgi:cytochrome c oxidase assembly protein subunit 15